jgi:hypothetical protein
LNGGRRRKIRNLQRQNADAGKKQQMEQRHQLQTEQMEQRHTQQQHNMQKKEHAAPPPKPKH